MRLINLPRLIAHRGASAFAPENTASSIRLAKAMGAQWVEFDITLSADKVVICFHDETLDRTTSGNGFVWDKNFAELKTLDCGSWFNPEFEGEKILSFAEMLALLNELELSANIELKSQPYQQYKLVDYMLSVFESSLFCATNQFLFSSFNHESLNYLRQQRPSYAIGVLAHDWHEHHLLTAHALDAISFHLPWACWSAERIKHVHEHQLYALAFTVNDAPLAHRLLSSQLDCIFSDHPNLL